MTSPALAMPSDQAKCQATEVLRSRIESSFKTLFGTTHITGLFLSRLSV
jgi:hypothetical protein